MKISTRFENFPPYQPIEPFEILSERLNMAPKMIIKLDANENPYGPSPLALQAIANLQFPNIYPDPESRKLRTALSEFTGVPAENLMAGAGADELIDLLLRVMLEPGDQVISSPPTFGMYSFDTLLNGGHLIETPRREDFSLDFPVIKKQVEENNPKIIFVASPNNPDGSMLDNNTVENLLELGPLVVIDEAYIEFATVRGDLGRSASYINLVKEHKNLVVLRTFSKWAGLAGLRVGYGAFPDWIMPVLWKAKQPYNVNVAAQAAAIASLLELDELAMNVERLQNERDKMLEALRIIPFLTPYPSSANFILCKVSGHSGQEIRSYLMEYGIMVRQYNNSYLKNYFRISAGRPHETELLIDVLRAFPEGMGESQKALQKRSELLIPDSSQESRTGRISRNTRETQIEVTVGLDGEGHYKFDTGLPFLEHMLSQIAVHGLFDLVVEAHGDLEIDPHHTVEDVALALGAAFREALGNRVGIVRMASEYCPMDESLALVTIDFSGRPYAVVDVDWFGAEVGGIPVTLITHFLESFSMEARCNLHARVFYGQDDHHKAEALFKALARAVMRAVEIDARRSNRVPSTKGKLF
jgi:histidinol-phosphate aminotransferase